MSNKTQERITYSKSQSNNIMATANIFGTSHYRILSHTAKCAPSLRPPSPHHASASTNSLQWAATAVEVYPLAVSLSKVSICVFYLRINPERFFRMTVYFVLFIIIGFTSAVVLAQLFGCSPISKFWNPLLLEAKCIDSSALYLSNGILNVVTDFLVLLLPIPMLVKLHTKTKQKWIIWGIFATGSLYVLPPTSSPSPPPTQSSSPHHHITIPPLHHHN